MFFSNQPMDIPKIFAQETVTIARSAFIKDPVGAQATGRWAEISPKPLDWMKQVDGYNLSYAREDATVSLVSTDEYLAPLVAHARRGLGRSAAVSFPLGGEFSETARNWPGYGDFLQTMGRFLMGEDTPPGIALRHRLDGTRLTLDLLYDSAAWSQKLSAMPPKVRLLDDAGGATLDLPWRRIAPGHFSLTRDLDEGSVVRGAVQVGENALPFGPLSVGSSVEWAFEPERLAELRAVSNQTGGRELLDISKAWLRPPFIAETSLRLPLGIALVLLTAGGSAAHPDRLETAATRTAEPGAQSTAGEDRETQKGRRLLFPSRSPPPETRISRSPATRGIRAECAIPTGEGQKVIRAELSRLRESTGKSIAIG